MSAFRFKLERFDYFILQMQGKNQRCPEAMLVVYLMCVLCYLPLQFHSLSIENIVGCRLPMCAMCAMCVCAHVIRILLSHTYRRHMCRSVGWHMHRVHCMKTLQVLPALHDGNFLLHENAFYLEMILHVCAHIHEMCSEYTLHCRKPKQFMENV